MTCQFCHAAFLDVDWYCAHIQSHFKNSCKNCKTILDRPTAVDHEQICEACSKIAQQPPPEKLKCVVCNESTFNTDYEIRIHMLAAHGKLSTKPLLTKPVHQLVDTTTPPPFKKHKREVLSPPRTNTSNDDHSSGGGLVLDEDDSGGEHRNVLTKLTIDSQALHNALGLNMFNNISPIGGSRSPAETLSQIATSMASQIKNLNASSASNDGAGTAMSSPRNMSTLPTTDSIMDSFNSLKPEQTIIPPITYPPHNKPFSCELCGKGFGYLPNLRTHVKTVHMKERDHSCDICGKTFTRSRTLKEHRRLHTGERPFVCKIDGCDKSFSRKQMYNDHLKSVHNATKQDIIRISQENGYETKDCNGPDTKSIKREPDQLLIQNEESLKNLPSYRETMQQGDPRLQELLSQL